MTPDDLEAIRKRAEAATDGPWRVVEEHGRDILDEGWSRIYIQSETGDQEEIADLLEDGTDADAEFIAHARADVPALLAALSEAQRERDELRATVRRAMDVIKGGAQSAAMVALAICSVGDGSPDVFDQLAAAEAESDRMRPVVEKAQAWHHGNWRTALELSDALDAAVDSYETQEGTHA